MGILGDREVWQYGDAEILDELRVEQDRLNARYARVLALTAELLARGLAASTGYGSAARLLQDVQRIGKGEAARRIEHANAITPVPSVSGPPLPPPLSATAAAVRAGAIGAEHVEAIRRTMVALPPEVPREDRDLAEKTLVDAAHQFDPAAVGKLGRAIQARLDQDGRPPTEAELREPVNELRWVTRRNGDLELKGRLSPEGGALLTTVLSPLAKPRPADEGTPDRRTTAERHGDALVDALRLLVANGQLPSEAGERPTLQVTVGLDALRTGVGAATLGDSTRIDARHARRLACDASVIPVVLGSQSEPLDIGRKTRTVPAAIRRALTLRDRGCAFAGCTMPAPWTDAHHLRHWADGGATALSNLVLLCSHHHRLIHHSDWQATITTSGIPEFTPPAYVDPTRQPRRNPTHHQTNDP